MTEQMREKKNIEEIKRLDGQINQFFAVVLGMTGDDSAKKRLDMITEQMNSIVRDMKTEPEKDETKDPLAGIKQLKALQGTIAQKRSQLKGGDRS